MSAIHGVLERLRDEVTSLEADVTEIKHDGRIFFRSGFASCKSGARDLITEAMKTASEASLAKRLRDLIGELEKRDFDNRFHGVAAEQDAGAVEATRDIVKRLRALLDE